MSKNYYDILELNRNATQEDITNAFKRLSLKFHPKNSTEEERAFFEYQFNLIAESYEVLSERKYIFNFLS